MAVLTLSPAACARVQVVWVQPVGTVHLRQQLADVHHLTHESICLREKQTLETWQTVADNVPQGRQVQHGSGGLYLLVVGRVSSQVGQVDKLHMEGPKFSQDTAASRRPAPVTTHSTGGGWGQR